MKGLFERKLFAIACILLIGLMAIQPIAARGCPGKQKWPEVVGLKGKKAAAIIEKENKFVNAIVLPEGSPTTKDFRCDRVWVFVDEYGVVVKTPIVT